MFTVRLVMVALCLGAQTILCLADEESPSSPVDLLMESISRDLKKLSRQFDNPASKASSRELVNAMIKANTGAKSITPESVGERTGAERETYLARYREGMEELGRCLADLKRALESDDHGAAEVLIEQVYGLRKKYHDELL